jgi:hypothetical protein
MQNVHEENRKVYLHNLFINLNINAWQRSFRDTESERIEHRVAHEQFAREVITPHNFTIILTCTQFIYSTILEYFTS